MAYMSVKIQDLSRVAEILIEVTPRFDDPTMISDHLKRAQLEVQQHPRSDKTVARFTLCGILIRVSAKSHLPSLERDFKRALKGCIPPKIGPDSNRHLSKADHLNDKMVESATHTS